MTCGNAGVGVFFGGSRGPTVGRGGTGWYFPEPPESPQDGATSRQNDLPGIPDYYLRSSRLRPIVTRMTITEAIQYDPATDGMTDPAFVGAWIDEQVAALVAAGMDGAAAHVIVYGLVDAAEDAA